MAISKILNTATGSISKILGTTFTSVSGVLGEFTGSAGGDDGGSAGAYTIAFFDGGDSTYRTGYHNTSITSINDDDGDDIKFKAVYGSTTLDLTSETQSDTQTAGSANSKKYAAVKFMAQGSSATHSLVQIVLTAVGTSTTMKVKVYSSTGFGGSAAPHTINGGASDATTIDSAGTKSFTWSSNAPTIAQGSSWWIVFEDQN